MKLAIATVVLAQTLPILAETSTNQNGWLNVRNKRRHLFTEKVLHRQKTSNKAIRSTKRRFSSETGLLLKNKPTSTLDSEETCDPTSADPDVGILSCGAGLACKPDPRSPVGGVCVEEKITLAECDPAFVDVGILACGPGEQCVASGESKLGGFCAKPIFRRRTQAYYGDDYLAHADADANADVDVLCSYDICDCSGFDYTTRIGTVECSYDECFGFAFSFSGCPRVCGKFSYSYDFQPNDVYVSKVCYQFTTPRAEQLCFTYISNAPNTCEVTFNGNECSLCDSTGRDLVYSCENVGGPTYPSNSAATIGEECYVPENGEYCEICSEPSTVFLANTNGAVGLGDFWSSITCQEIAQANSENLISEAKCDEIRSEANRLCCGNREPAPTSAAVDVGLLSGAGAVVTAMLFAWN